MRRSWRPVALGAVLTVLTGAGVAQAQTVVVRNAPPGSSIDLAFNAATSATATVSPSGEATLAIKNAGDTEKDVHLYVDTCGKSRHVVLVERYAQAPAPGDGCDRKEIAGFFVMRRTTTFVLDVGGADPMVWLRQGPAPPEWLTQSAAATSGEVPVTRRPSPKGFVLSGGGGFTTFRDVVSQACGPVVDCSGKDFDLSYTVSAAFWLTRFLAAEAGFVKPSSMDITGSDQGFHFTSTFEPRIYTIAGKVGVPIGPVRFYGQAGTNYHEATLTTSNTLDDRTLALADGTTETIPGGTQTFVLKTAGWGYLFGGGLEGWVGRRTAIYAEVTRAQIKGTSAGGEGSIDDRVTMILFGARVRVGS